MEKILWEKKKNGPKGSNRFRSVSRISKLSIPTLTRSGASSISVARKSDEAHFSLIMQQRSHQRLDLLPHLRVGAREREVRLQPVDRVADVVTLGAQHDPVNRLALQQQLQRI